VCMGGGGMEIRLHNVAPLAERMNGTRYIGGQVTHIELNASNGKRAPVV
jgi:hypothetical protein